MEITQWVIALSYPVQVVTSPGERRRVDGCTDIVDVYYSVCGVLRAFVLFPVIHVN